MQKNSNISDTAKESKAGSSSSRQPYQKARNPFKAKHDIIVSEENSDDYSDSFEEPSIETEDPIRSDIISRINALPLEKLSSVLSFLDTIDPKPIPGRPKPVIHKGKRPYSGKTNSHVYEIEIKVISTWGHAHLAGVTEIEVFSSSQDIIKLTQNMIHVKNSGPGALSNPGRMIDGEKRTDDDKHMWVVPLPVPPLNLEICLSLTSNEPPAGMRVWNYNKSFLDSVKGIREVQIYKDKELVWEGIIQRGCGNKVDDYSTDIPLIPGFNIKPDVEEKEQESLPVWVEPKNNEDKKSRDKRLRPVASVPRVMHQPENDFLDEPKVERPHINPSVLNFKKQVNTGRDRKVEKDREDQKLIPEPALKILGFNSKKKFVSEPLKESLESLEFFKITNESRIKRERIVNPKPIENSSKPTEVKLIEAKPKIDAPDILDKFLAEQALPKPSDFRIPNLPRGQLLKFTILSTWGDQHYVGLSGIEIFDDLGNLIKFPNPKLQITANPPDVNILPGYGTDPRTIDKLLDGTNWTCDDLHVWLAPYTKGQVNTITIDLISPVCISLIRIWNYNKSRIHSFRGAKDLEIHMDRVMIFKGEINKAPGRILDADQYCEYILLTKEEGIIRRIDANDWVKDFEHNQDADNELMSTIRLQNRPGTASKQIGEDGRPMTSAKLPKPAASNASVFGKKFRILIIDTWGDAYYVGLTGLLFIGLDGPIAIQKHWIEAIPRDMNVIPGYSGDYRTLEKLINNKNVTTDDHNMWLIPYTKGKYHYIDIDLQENRHITGISFWNYNKNLEDTSRGVKDIMIYMDGKPLTEFGVTLRKAPGRSDFDFAQTINFPYKDVINDVQRPLFASAIVKQDYETPCLPIGYIITFKLLNTWGDMHYIGLNAIEIYDNTGKEVIQNGIGCRISANPSSVRDISGMNEDVRTPDKLIDGVCNTKDDRHMWLAPFQTPGTYFNLHGGQPNEVSIIFDKKVCIGYIRIWNYGKTPTRAVKEYGVLIDDSIVYKGYLRQTGSSVVLFTGDPAVAQRVVDQVYRYEGDKVNVIQYNEGKLVGGLEQHKIMAERPMTSVVKQY
jgi:protein JBTS26